MAFAECRFCWAWLDITFLECQVGNASCCLNRTALEGLRELCKCTESYDVVDNQVWSVWQIEQNTSYRFALPEMSMLKADVLACRRRQDAGRSGKAAWPPDWGPGDASRFAEFPELPKSRTQLGPPRKGPMVREGIDKAPTAQEPIAGLGSDIGSPSNILSLEDTQNLSSADLDAMVFQQQPYKRAAGLQKQ